MYAQFLSEMSLLLNGISLLTCFPFFAFFILALNEIVFLAFLMSCEVHFDFGFFSSFRFLFIGALERLAFFDQGFAAHFFN